MPRPPATPAILLAGGLARRMGGGDKPMRKLAGRSILERVIARFASFGLPVIADSVADYPGICLLRRAIPSRHRTLEVTLREKLRHALVAEKVRQGREAGPHAFPLP